MHVPKEPLINSERAAMRFETVSGKARIAANSRTIGKIRNAAGGRFGLIDAVHELIRGSLSMLITQWDWIDPPTESGL